MLSIILPSVDRQFVFEKLALDSYMQDMPMWDPKSFILIQTVFSIPRVWLTILLAETSM